MNFTPSYLTWLLALGVVGFITGAWASAQNLDPWGPSIVLVVFAVAGTILGKHLKWF